MTEFDHKAENIVIVIPTQYDNQPPVFYLAIRQRSKDLKHLIVGTGPTKLQG